MTSPGRAPAPERRRPGEGSRAALLALALGALAIGGVWLLLRPPGAGGTRGALGVGAEGPPAMTEASGPTPGSAGTGTPAAPDPGGTAEGEGGARAAPAAPGAPRKTPSEQLAAQVEAYVRLLGEKAAARAAGGATEAAWERAFAQALYRLQGAAESHPALALELLAAAEAAPDEAWGVRLARALRPATHPELIHVLQGRLRDRTGDPRPRRLALEALELRPYDAWGAVTVDAFHHDPDPGVRDRAAGLLGRALAQPTYLAQHTALRKTLAEALASDEAAQRRRTLEALLAERSPTPALLERVEALARADPDADVRRQAASTARVLKTRIDARAQAR